MLVGFCVYIFTFKSTVHPSIETLTYRDFFMNFNTKHIMLKTNVTHTHMHTDHYNPNLFANSKTV